MGDLEEECSLASFAFLVILGDLRKSLTGMRLLILILGFLFNLGSRTFSELGVLAVSTFRVSSLLSKLSIDSGSW